MTATQKEDLARHALRKKWREEGSGNLTLKDKLEALANAGRAGERITYTLNEKAQYKRTGRNAP